MRVNLDVLKNDEVLASFDFSREVIGEEGQKFTALLGRGENCFVQIEDRLISREQAAIGFENGKWFYENLSKFKPTFDENNNEIKKILVESNKELQVGGYTLLFKFDASYIPENAVEEKAKVDEVLEGNSNVGTEEALTGEVREEDEESLGEESLESISDDFSENDEEQSYSDETEVSEEYSEGGQDYSDENEFGSEEEYSDGDEFSSEDSFDSGDDFEDGGGDYAIEESGDKTEVFTGHVNFYVEIFGEHAPYEKYTIKDGDNLIGRDEENTQIPLLDQEVSSKHANLKKVKGKVFLIDLESANGTLLNGVRINEETLKDSDEFIIGSTTFTFRAKNDFLSGEADRFLPVEENQVIEVQEVVEVDELDVSEEDSSSEMPEDAQKSIVKKLIWKYKQLPRNKQIIYGVVGLFAIFMFLDSEEPPKKVAGKKPGKEKVVDGKVVAEGEEEKKKPQTKAEQLFNALSPEDQQFIISTYQLGFEFIQQAKYEDALRELDKVQKLIPKYKDTESLIQVASSGFRELEELEKKRLAEIEEKRRQEKINSLVEKAKGYVKDKSVGPAESTFSQILAMDPENLDVPSLRMEIDAWKREKERKAVEKAQKEEKENEN